jgi:hypothetical protein
MSSTLLMCRECDETDRLARNRLGSNSRSDCLVHTRNGIRCVDNLQALKRADDQAKMKRCEPEGLVSGQGWGCDVWKTSQTCSLRHRRFPRWGIGDISEDDRPFGSGNALCAEENLNVMAIKTSRTL